MRTVNKEDDGLGLLSILRLGHVGVQACDLLDAALGCALLDFAGEAA